jgi:hypothetical protein
VVTRTGTSHSDLPRDKILSVKDYAKDLRVRFLFLDAFSIFGDMDHLSEALKFAHQIAK